MNVESRRFSNALRDTPMYQEFSQPRSFVLQLVSSRILQDIYRRIARKDHRRNLDLSKRPRPASNQPTRLLLRTRRRIILTRDRHRTSIRHPVSRPYNHRRSPPKDRRIFHRTTNHPTYHPLTILVLPRHRPIRTLALPLSRRIAPLLSNPPLPLESRPVTVTRHQASPPVHPVDSPRHPVSPLLMAIRLKGRVLPTCHPRKDQLLTMDIP